ncbi:MAG: 2,3-diaminopropionate biosynthesis protein SbnA [Wenzhouxiangellaceae bacterium]
MYKINTGLLDLVGNTPVVRMRPHYGSKFTNLELYAKLEYYNPTGSIKDRPAAYIIRHMMLRGEIQPGSTVIESSSGNFGIALAAVCRAEKIKFICVVDPGILPHNEFLLRQYGAQIVKITEKDDTGGYLKSRIRYIHDYIAKHPEVKWFNQYENEKNGLAHYYGTGLEIYKTFSDYGLDYVFIPVGSGGTVTGVSRLLKEQFPNIQIVAVDSDGSVIFNGPPKPRFIPGMGSSIRPKLLDNAHIDHVVTVKEQNAVKGCLEMLDHYSLFVGGSSGATYWAAKQFFGLCDEHGDALKSAPVIDLEARKALLLLVDRGERYSSTVYNPEWVKAKFDMAV